ncbi:hypothetical protein MAPG_10175 [Magnaporthiopsis poae ATCC 64411]|uniref:Uncharacterized protein n=1 Tax=Magnaporthiopsis poae (strain ATCC 64411 / 73-15) TaxID=644358 RepID=A0A0C4EBW3_MAGP6|nr:hypothetical protein MAPG_10175 [Magnaporthiopsis poae ATCC 64411]
MGWLSDKPFLSCTAAITSGVEAIVVRQIQARSLGEVAPDCVCAGGGMFEIKGTLFCSCGGMGETRGLRRRFSTPMQRFSEASSVYYTRGSLLVKVLKHFGGGGLTLSVFGSIRCWAPSP